tara:strand:+ start:445 stop:708 length:264 start_codon:yes stop_codon:yes gene_type:complete
MKALPTWFDGLKYSDGEEATNPYTGESILLNANELSMYDYIKGCEMLISVLGHESDKAPSVSLRRKALDWFKVSSPQAYMILLDNNT